MQRGDACGAVVAAGHLREPEGIIREFDAARTGGQLEIDLPVETEGLGVGFDHLPAQGMGPKLAEHGVDRLGERVLQADAVGIFRAFRLDLGLGEGVLAPAVVQHGAGVQVAGFHGGCRGDDLEDAGGGEPALQAGVARGVRLVVTHHGQDPAVPRIHDYDPDGA